MNNPLAYVDPLGLWAIQAVPWYKITGYDKDGNPIYATDSKGNRIVDHVTWVAYRSQDDDTAASLAEQLGLSGDAAKEFVSKVGDQTSVQLSNTTGDTKRIYGVIETLVKMQLNHRGANGPAHILYWDCSNTACKLAFPNENQITFNVGLADDLIRDKNLKSVSSGELSIGDIVRYARGNTPTHFTTFIFRDDTGVPIVFSRTGERGPFQYGAATDFQNPTYGTIRGIGKAPTGFYKR